MNRVRDVLVALRRIIRATDLHSKYLVKTTGLTAAQLLLMRSIQEKGAVAIGELAEEIHLSQATVTTILDRLEDRQLLARNRSTEDKRRIHVDLTEAGFALLKKSDVPLLRENFVRKFSDMEEWQQAQLVSSLLRVAEMMDGNGVDSSPAAEVRTLEQHRG